LLDGVGVLSTARRFKILEQVDAKTV
jgi:hypothetical protein